MRGLLYFWRAHLAVTLGAAVACAVLTGALVVGDSVRGSLAHLVLDRLGNVDQAVVSATFVRPELARDLEAASQGGLRVEPMVLLRGSVTHRSQGSDAGPESERQRRASNVQVFGVGSAFVDLFPENPPFSFEPPGGGRSISPGAVVNESLARELEVEPGDTILLAVERPAEVPRETLVGRADAGDTIERLRLAVTAVVPDSGVGGFRLSPQQAAPLNLFIELDRLQRGLFGRNHEGRVNTLLLSRIDRGAQKSGGAEQPATAGNGAAAVSELLAEAVELDDLSVLLTSTATGAKIGSRQFVLDDATTDLVTAFAGDHGFAVRASLTYLANGLESSSGSVPYSTITGLDPASDSSLPALVLTSGAPAPALADDQILIDAWSAEDLGAEIGQPIEVTYYELGARDELSETTVVLRLAGVVALVGPAVDSGLTPEFPGMADAENISAWDPPFPVELARVRERDEDYWDLYRAAPKAFVSLATARKLWASRFGQTTTLEIAAQARASAPEQPSAAASTRLEAVLRAELPARLVNAGGAQRIRQRPSGPRPARRWPRRREWRH